MRCYSKLWGVIETTKTCFLFGHRDTPQKIQQEIEAAVEKLYLEQNVRYFYVGGYGDFDRMASAAVRAVKNRYSDITLSLVSHTIPQNVPLKCLKGLKDRIILLLEMFQIDMRLFVPTDIW